jgi:hypothetical protein
MWAEDVQFLKVRCVRVDGPDNGKPFLKGKDIADYDVEKPLGWSGETVGLRE